MVHQPLIFQVQVPGRGRPFRSLGRRRRPRRRHMLWKHRTLGRLRELPGIGTWRVGLEMFKVIFWCFFWWFWLILRWIYGNMFAGCAPNILLECVWTILNPQKPVSNTVWESVWNHGVWIWFIKRSAKKIKKTFWTWPTKIRGWC